MILYGDFQSAIEDCLFKLKADGKVLQPRRWQGIDVAQNPHMACLEITHLNFSVPMEGTIKDFQESILPELPWADLHFEERVCGFPINPGEQFKHWSWNKGKGAESFLDFRGKFNHNYMERYWPKFAKVVKEPTANASEYRQRYKDYFQSDFNARKPLGGILYTYGDLSDVIDLMVDDPLTRQAYLPVWFPEDTGGGNKRAPCTIGYHFMMRDDRLSINYHLRSCDAVKHFRNDIYLTVRLAEWLLGQLKSKQPAWDPVKLGDLYMQIGSFHSFKPDWELL